MKLVSIWKLKKQVSKLMVAYLWCTGIFLEVIHRKMETLLKAPCTLAY